MPDTVRQLHLHWVAAPSDLKSLRGRIFTTRVLVRVKPHTDWLVALAGDSSKTACEAYQLRFGERTHCLRWFNSIVAHVGFLIVEHELLYFIHIDFCWDQGTLQFNNVVVAVLVVTVPSFRMSANLVHPQRGLTFIVTIVHSAIILLGRWQMFVGRVVASNECRINPLTIVRIVDTVLQLSEKSEVLHMQHRERDNSGCVTTYIGGSVMCLGS